VTEVIPWLRASGPEPREWTPNFPFSYPCYEHATLTDLLNGASLSWKFYPHSAGGLWTAPNAIQHMCQPNNGTIPGDVCVGSDWVGHVAPYVPPNPPQAGKMAPILTDIENCQLAAVSWVVPDGDWSDHAGEHSGPDGPSWVAAIVNDVGRSHCDGNGYWRNTAIFVTWDDWGGWFDHVMPPQPFRDQYELGFRVPLIVVSAYTPPAYVSGSFSPSQPNTPCDINTGDPNHCYDFGSILRFVEENFGLGEISPNYHYADRLANKLDDGFFSYPLRTPFVPIPARRMMRTTSRISGRIREIPHPPIPTTMLLKTRLRARKLVLGSQGPAPLNSSDVCRTFC